MKYYNNIKPFLLCFCLLIFVQQSVAQDTLEVVEIEYFFDSDPGYGNANSLSVGPDSTVILEPIIAEASSLSKGFHTLFVRARNVQKYYSYNTVDTGTNIIYPDSTIKSSLRSLGQWGLAESRLVYVDEFDVFTLQLLDSIEYFFDVDPGYGNGTIINSFTPSSVVNLAGEALDAGSLDVGFHTLFLRAKGEGGLWGASESRLVYVDPSPANQVQIVDRLEYFFDVDPGYGNATPINISESEIVNIQELLNASNLELGFHNLFIRAAVQNGNWAHYEQRLVYVDQAGAISLSPIAGFEYFYDTDPGYGNGYFIAVDPPDSTVISEFLLTADTLSEGFHTLYVRAINEDGSYGLAEDTTFRALPPGRELDSVALSLIYDKLEGTNWTNTNNWLVSAIDSWFGVSVSGDRVQSVILPNNNLTGEVPREFSFLTAATSFNLSGNNLQDTIPDKITELTNLQTLRIDNNQISGLPDFSQITSLNNLQVEENLLDFADLEPLVGITNFSYSPQSQTGISNLDTTIRLGDDFEATFDAPGTANTYQWFKDGDTLAGFENNTLLVSGFSLEDAGAYRLRIGNTLLPELTLNSGVFNLLLLGLDQDSVALIAIYNSTDGTNWSNSSGWLLDSLQNWFGVEVANGRVRELNLSSNSLSGQLPPEIANISELQVIDLSNNTILDTIPSEITQLSQLRKLVLSNNRITSIPDLDVIGALDTLDVSGNALQFGDLEANSGIQVFTYNNQDSVGIASDTLIERGESYSQAVSVSGQNNIYQWFRDDEVVSGLTNDNFSYSAVDYNDIGTYRLEVTNSALPDLTIYSRPAILDVTSLRQDSIALIAFYDSTGGESWIPQLNWKTQPLANWDSIGFTGNRVSSVSLSSSGISGPLEDELLGVAGLEEIDLSSNQIDSIPDFSSLELLTSLDISDNRLQFGPLEVNAGISGINYESQANLRADTDTIVDKDIDYGIQYLVSGSANNYQWLKNGDTINGETSPEITFTNIQFEDAGTYSLNVTNDLVPGLIISSGDLLLRVSSLKQDSVSLLALYDSAGGTNWSPQVNWLTSPVTQWDGIGITNNRVTSVELASANLSGSVPADIRFLLSLERLNVSDNNIEKLANLTSMQNLQNVDVRGNRLDFDDLDPNVGVAGFEFNPQQALDLGTEELVIPQGSSFTLSTTVAGENNSYIWLRNDTLDITGSFEGTYEDDSITRSEMGDYQLIVTSPATLAADPSFSLQSDKINVLATADISGTIRTITGDGLSTGTLNVLRIRKDRNAFDTLTTVNVTEGAFLVNDIVLDDYVLLTQPPEASTIIPTYYRNTEDWVNADTIKLVQDIEINDYVMVQEPDEPLDGDGQLDMLVESDFAEEDARIDARRRVRKAGCSLRRRVTGGGRIDQDEYVLIAYKETDDEGNVSFGNLPAGEYRINIQYPGIPMDETSDIDFVIEEGEENAAFEASVTITEDGISVELEKVLGFIRKYFKDLVIYPNPADESFTLQYKQMLSKNVHLQMVSLSGAKAQEAIKVESGFDKTMTVKTLDLPEGVYILKFFDQDKRGEVVLTYKILVSH